MKYQKKSDFEKEVNRVQRRLKTQEERGEFIHSDVDPDDRASIEELVKAVREANPGASSTDIVDTAQASVSINKEVAKQYKKEFGLKSWKHFAGMSNTEMHDKITEAINSGMDREAVLEIFGYKE